MSEAGKQRKKILVDQESLTVLIQASLKEATTPVQERVGRINLPVIEREARKQLVGEGALHFWAESLVVGPVYTEAEKRELQDEYATWSPDTLAIRLAEYQYKASAIMAELDKLAQTAVNISTKDKNDEHPV